MRVATAFRQAHVNGRLTHAMGGISKPWRRRRMRRLQRILWLVGLGVGMLMIVGLLWNLVASREFDGS